MAPVSGPTPLLRSEAAYFALSRKRDGWREGLATFEYHRGFLKRVGVGKNSPFREGRIWLGWTEAEIAIFQPAAEGGRSDSAFSISKMVLDRLAEDA